MPDLFEQVIAEATLLAAWREVQVNDLEDGRVNEQVVAYSRDLFANLASLRASLQGGTYRPNPVYAMEIPKQSGGKRLIAVPAVADRIVERALMEVIDEHIDAVLLPWSYAYRRGLSVEDALHDLARARDDGARWVVRASMSWSVGSAVRGGGVASCPRCHASRRLLAPAHRPPEDLAAWPPTPSTMMNTRRLDP
ncbi:hypothetical protein ACFO6V_07170 [Promicromonospora alba]|uniref:Reverse transcriptase (RNA-dependent DNA polymerase) n=1 Tax=Promicromonospora alba TaxID=1616110 RepID=A0ABV9HFT6_9MICO